MVTSTEIGAISTILVIYVLEGQSAFFGKSAYLYVEVVNHFVMNMINSQPSSGNLLICVRLYNGDSGILERFMRLFILVFEAY